MNYHSAINTRSYLAMCMYFPGALYIQRACSVIQNGIPNSLRRFRFCSAESSGTIHEN